MSKFKKPKAPKIDPRVMARSRLDALFEQQSVGKIDLDQLEAGVRSLMVELSQPLVLDALLKRIESKPEGERNTPLALLPRLKSPEVIDHLWQVVNKPGGFSGGAKMIALIILKAMDEEVDIKNPGAYFSADEFKPGDIHTAQGLFQLGMSGLARGLRQASDPTEVEALMHRVNQMPKESMAGTGILLEYIKTGEESATDLEADFFFALANTTPYREVQQKAQRALERLASKGVRPVTRAILNLTQDHFFGAFTTDPNHPWQQNVTVAWERAGGVIQALVFLLDFGVPWGGAIKDMFATRGMTPKEFKRSLVDKAERQTGERLYQVSLARAQAMVTAAVEANRKHKVPLPKEFEEVRHLVERWVLNPSSAALMADSTTDELGDLPLALDRSKKPALLDLRDLTHNAAVRRWLEQQGPKSDGEEADSELKDAGPSK